MRVVNYLYICVRSVCDVPTVNCEYPMCKIQCNDYTCKFQNSDGYCTLKNIQLKNKVCQNYEKNIMSYKENSNG